MQSSSKLVLFASEDAHYSIHKMAALLGIGEKNVNLVSVDECGRMDPSDLEEQIKTKLADGFTPFLIVATAGWIYIIKLVKSLLNL